jgi:hypothetical protein
MLKMERSECFVSITLIVASEIRVSDLMTSSKDLLVVECKFIRLEGELVDF